MPIRSTLLDDYDLSDSFQISSLNVVLHVLVNNLRDSFWMFAKYFLAKMSGGGSHIFKEGWLTNYVHLFANPSRNALFANVHNTFLINWIAVQSHLKT